MESDDMTDRMHLVQKTAVGGPKARTPRQLVRTLRDPPEPVHEDTGDPRRRIFRSLCFNELLEAFSERRFCGAAAEDHSDVQGTRGGVVIGHAPRISPFDRQN
jgi:hypothetical protein